VRLQLPAPTRPAGSPCAIGREARDGPPSVAHDHAGAHARDLPDTSLRRLVLRDERCIQSMLGIHLSNSESNSEAAGLDPKTNALVRLSGLVAIGASCYSYRWAGRSGPGRRCLCRGGCQYPGRGGGYQRASPRNLCHPRGRRRDRLRHRPGVRGAGQRFARVTWKADTHGARACWQAPGAPATGWRRSGRAWGITSRSPAS
jgi:hypothetical protein